jgi:hypothetical protein
MKENHLCHDVYLHQLLLLISPHELGDRMFKITAALAA